MTRDRAKFKHPRSSDGAHNPDADFKNAPRTKIIHYKGLVGDLMIPDHLTENEREREREFPVPYMRRRLSDRRLTKKIKDQNTSEPGTFIFTFI